jgi:hypothetical protein
VLRSGHQLPEPRHAGGKELDAPHIKEKEELVYLYVEKPRPRKMAGLMDKYEARKRQDNLKDFHHIGSFYLTQSDETEPDSLGNQSHNLMVNFPDRTYSLTFQIEPKDFRTNYYMTFYADDAFPIAQGERMKVRYSKTSQLGIIDDDYEEEEEDVELP